MLLEVINVTYEELLAKAISLADSIRADPAAYAPNIYTGDHRDAFIMTDGSTIITEYVHPNAVRAGSALAKIMAKDPASAGIWIGVMYTKRPRPARHDKDMAQRVLSAARLVDIPVYAIAFANAKGREILYANFVGLTDSPSESENER